MKHNRKTFMLGYIIAGCTSAAALVLRHMLTPWLGQEAPLLVLVLAPLLSSACGMRPGLLATLICALGGTWFFLEPLGSFTIASASDRLRLLLFIVIGFVISLLGGLRLKAEGRLRESEARKSAMINTSLDAILMIDAHGKIVEFNPAAEKIFGYGRLEALGREMAELIVPPALRERHRRGLARYVKTGEARVMNRRLELRAMRADGGEFPVELIITKVASEDAPLFTGYVRDITERQQAERALRGSEEKFRDLADNISQLAWMADETGYRFWYNKRWLEYTGAELGEILGWGWKRYHHPEHLERVTRKLSHSIETGEPWEDVFPLRGKNGRYRWFLSHALPIRDENGRIARWFGTNTDIDQQMQLQEELRITALRLAETDQRKDEFLATLAHELRNPLAPIRSGLEVLRKAEGLPEEVSNVLGMIERQTKQLIKLVDDLLDISRITTGKLELHKQRVKLQEIVETAVETARPLVEAAGQTLVSSLPPQAVVLDADPHRLAQVLSNLLNNASKYTPAGGRIWIGTRPHEESVIISVKDTGVGIPGDKLESIFEMFTQVDRPLEKGYAGLGIGLTLAKSLVEMHEGRIEVLSPGVNQGSEFHVYLPIGEESVPIHEAGSPMNARRTNAARRVLIVDDNQDAAESLSLLVKLEGHEVRTAVDGKQAIEAAEELRPHLILMDIGMPVMNGYEAARRIRAASWSKGMKMVALTGWGQQEDRQRTRAAGFDDHLVKPVEMGEVLKLLDRNLEDACE